RDWSSDVCSSALVGLRQQQQRGAVACADVDDASPGLQLLVHAVQRWDPLVDQAVAVADAEEPLGPLERGVILIAPRDASTAAERLDELVGPPVHAADLWRCPDHGGG